MKVEYSNRAVADLHKLADDSLIFGEAVAAAVEERIRAIIKHIGEYPQAAQGVAERPASISCRSFVTLTRFFTGCWMIG